VELKTEDLSTAILIFEVPWRLRGADASCYWASSCDTLTTKLIASASYARDFG
jgi:hypothetical protein